VSAPDRWHFRYFSPEMGAELQEQLTSADAMLLGRATYEEFAAYWPNQPSGTPFADINNNMRKYVVSTTLRHADWHNTTLVNKDIPAALEGLRRDSGGDLHVTGSATLVRYLLGQGLLDELRLQVSPVVVGAGARLFPDGTGHTSLTLVRSATLPGGVLSLTYRP